MSQYQTSQVWDNISEVKIRYTDVELSNTWGQLKESGLLRPHPSDWFLLSFEVQTFLEEKHRNVTKFLHLEKKHLRNESTIFLCQLLQSSCAEEKVLEFSTSDQMQFISAPLSEKYISYQFLPKLHPDVMIKAVWVEVALEDIQRQQCSSDSAASQVVEHPFCNISVIKGVRTSEGVRHLQFQISLTQQKERYPALTRFLYWRETNVSLSKEQKYFSWDEGKNLCSRYGWALPAFNSRSNLQEFLLFFKLNQQVPLLDLVFLGLKYKGREKVSQHTTCLFVCFSLIKFHSTKTCDMSKVAMLQNKPHWSPTLLSDQTVFYCIQLDPNPEFHKVHPNIEENLHFGDWENKRETKAKNRFVAAHAQFIFFLLFLFQVHQKTKRQPITYHLWLRRQHMIKPFTFRHVYFAQSNVHHLESSLNVLQPSMLENETCVAMIMVTETQPQWITIHCHVAHVSYVTCVNMDNSTSIHHMLGANTSSTACQDSAVFKGENCFEFMFYSSIMQASSLFKEKHFTQINSIHMLKSLLVAVSVQFPAILSFEHSTNTIKIFSYLRHFNTFIFFEKDGAKSQARTGCFVKITSASTNTHLGENLFRCKNGTFIGSVFVCDCMAHCGPFDNSDEVHCTYNHNVTKKKVKSRQLCSGGKSRTFSSLAFK